MNIPDHTVFPRAKKQFFGLKILHVDPLPGSLGPWIRDGKIGIRDTHPGSTTLMLHINCFNEAKLMFSAVDLWSIKVLWNYNQKLSTFETTCHASPNVPLPNSWTFSYFPVKQSPIAF
jgi:hypothetical protein